MTEELNKICKEEFNKFFPKTRIKYIRKKYHSPRGRLKVCKKDMSKVIVNIIVQQFPLVYNEQEIKTNDMLDPLTYLFQYIDKSVENDKIAIGNQVYSIELKGEKNK